MLIRTIHHLSSSGGTVFSKCVAALPDVVLLSEVNPNEWGPYRFSPADPLQQFAQCYPDAPFSESDGHAAFRERLRPALEYCERSGKALVLRDHSHSDFLMEQVRTPGLMAALSPHHEIRSIVTIRHPLDAWLGMKAHKFNVHIPHFERYCARVKAFLAWYEGVPVFKYEAFLKSPKQTMQEVCARLELEYDPRFLKSFADKTLSGDSGRYAGRRGLKRPPRRLHSITRSRRAAIKEYREICERFGYSL